MRVKSLKTVIAFFTTSDAMETEAIFTENNILGRLIPIPREITAGCGLAWMMPPEEYKKIPPEVMILIPKPEVVKEIML
jgi:hypothetical protein